MEWTNQVFGILKNKCQVGEATAYFEDGTVAKEDEFAPIPAKNYTTIQYYRQQGKVERTARRSLHNHQL